MHAASSYLYTAALETRFYLQFVYCRVGNAVLIAICISQRWKRGCTRYLYTAIRVPRPPTNGAMHLEVIPWRKWNRPLWPPQANAKKRIEIKPKFKSEALLFALRHENSLARGLTTYHAFHPTLCPRSRRANVDPFRRRSPLPSEREGERRK